MNDLSDQYSDFKFSKCRVENERFEFCEANKEFFGQRKTVAKGVQKLSH